MTDTEHTAASAPTSSGLMGEAPASAPAQPPSLGNATMAQALVDRGVWTPEQAAEALANPDAEPEASGQPASGVSAAGDATELQGALVSAGIDQPTAQFVGKLFRDAAQVPPTEDQRQAAMQSTEQHLRGEWGENYETLVGAAQREMWEIARTFPKLPGMLEATGLGNHPWIIRQLAQRAYDRAAKRHLGKG